MKGSPFVKPFEKEMNEWEAKLMSMQQITDNWLTVRLPLPHHSPVVIYFAGFFDESVKIAPLIFLSQNFYDIHLELLNCNFQRRRRLQS